MRSAIYEGTLMHARRSPVKNVFTYPVSYWLLDLDELPEIERKLALFAHNGRNVVSFRDRDHFDGGPSAKQAVLELVADDSVERVLVLTQPRVFGYVFNPVSFYWCYRADGSLSCMVAELSNTFGERLPEVLRGPGPQYEHDKHKIASGTEDNATNNPRYDCSWPGFYSYCCPKCNTNSCPCHCTAPAASLLHNLNRNWFETFFLDGSFACQFEIVSCKTNSEYSNNPCPFN